MPSLETKKISYKYLANYLQERIRSGEIAPGEQLPSGRELAEKFRLSYLTARQALKLLVERGLCYSEPNKGFYVCDSLRLNRRSVFVSVLQTSVISTQSWALYGDIITELKDALNCHGYEVVVNVWNDDDQPSGSMPTVPPNVRAIVILGSELARISNLLNYAFQMQIPICTFYTDMREGITSVGADLYLAGQLMARHLVKRGITKAGYIVGCSEKMRLPARQFEGFMAEAASLGIETKPEWVITDDLDWWSIEAGYEGMRRIMSNQVYPQAIAAQTDRVAVGAIRKLSDLGLRCPEDMLVIGSGREDIGQYYNPRITTIDICHDKIAEQMVNYIIKRVETPQQAVPFIQLVPEVIEGESA